MPLQPKSPLDLLATPGTTSVCLLSAILPKRTTDEQVRKAVQQTVSIHPRLAYKSVKGYFKYPITDFEIYVWEKPENWNSEKEIEKAMNEPLAGPWRLIVYQKGDIDTEVHVVLSMDNQIGDTASSVIVCETIVKCLAQIASGVETPITEPAKPFMVEESVSFLDLFSCHAPYSLAQAFNRFRRSKDSYTDKPLDRIDSRANICKTVKIVGSHAQKIYDRLGKDQIKIESLITVAFLTCCRQLIESTTSVDYNPLKSKFRHLLTFVFPVAIMIVLCYQQGMDSWAWIPSLMVFIVGRRVTREQTIKLNSMTFGYSVDTRPKGNRSVGNYMLSFLYFNYPLFDKDLFWGHVHKLEFILTSLKKLVPSMLVLASYLPNSLFIPRKNRDVTGLISVVNACTTESSYTILDVQSATSCSNVENRALMNATITKSKDTFINITYPSELFSFADVDLFIGLLQTTLIRALRDESLNLEHQVQK